MLSWRLARQREGVRPPPRPAHVSDLTGMAHETASLLACRTAARRRARRRRLRRRLEEASRPTRSHASGATRSRRAQFNVLLAGAKRSVHRARRRRSRSRAPTQYKALQDQAMQYLVQQSELEQKAKDLGVDGHRQGRRHAARADQEAVLRRQGASYQKQLKAQGLTEPQLELDLHAQILSREALQRGHRQAQGHGRRDQEVLQRQQVAVRDGGEPRRAPHPREQQEARRHDRGAAEGRRQLRSAREEVLEGSGLGRKRRQAHDHEGSDGCAVRQGRVHAQDERDLAAGAHAVRLAHHPGALRGQAGEDDAARSGQGADLAAAAADEDARPR